MEKVEKTYGESIKSVFDFYDIMDRNNLIMVYEGYFNQEITKSVLAMTERNFDSEGVDASVKKKIFNVMVEALQNICKHQDAAKDADGETSSIFMIGYDEVNFIYTVISGNLINNDRIPGLKKKIDDINVLDKDGLKDLYKKARLASTISNVGGAGLGFIDMARKSGRKLEYSFDFVTPEVSFYTLAVRISSKKEEE